MDSKSKIAVCSRSFSKNPILRHELLSRYKNVTFNDSGKQLEGNNLVEFLKYHDKAITALETIDENILSQLPELKVIGKYGVGLDMIEMEAMRKYGVRLGWVGGVNRRSVSELVIAFAVNMLRYVGVANNEVRSGIWRQLMGGQLSGRTVGIIGCGHVGKDLVKLLEPFGCKVLVNDILDYPDFYKLHNIEAVSLPELMANSDVVSVHVPLNESTCGILNREILSLMKSSAILINVARGGLVDELALKEMLKNKLLAGAAFDVFAAEPPLDSELLLLPDFLATPHIGGSSEEAVLAMGRAAIKGLEINSLPEINHQLT
jgi:phosphoglycerate dehydrogenase-like enzyme